jgi:hypothetical protein
VLYRIQRFGIKQTSKMAGIVYFVLGIVLIPFLYAGMNAPPLPGEPTHPAAFTPAMLLLVPALYGSVGYVMTALILFIYNRIAKSAGGVELDIVYAVEPSPAAEHGAPSAPSP